MKYDIVLMLQRSLVGMVGPAFLALMDQLSRPAIDWRAVLVAALGGFVAGWGIDLGAYNRAKALGEHPDEG